MLYCASGLNNIKEEAQIASVPMAPTSNKSSLAMMPSGLAGVLFFPHIRHAKPTYSRKCIWWKAWTACLLSLSTVAGTGVIQDTVQLPTAKKGGVFKDAIRQFAKDRGLTGCQQSFMRATRQGGGTLPCRPTSWGRLGCLRCLSAMACSTSCTAHAPRLNDEYKGGRGRGLTLYFMSQSWLPTKSVNLLHHGCSM